MNQNQIVIQTNSENEKKMLPMNLLVTLAAGAIAGMAVAFPIAIGLALVIGVVVNYM